MRLTKVSFRYRRHDPFVIEEADACLTPGDVIELSGVNGAGKSTLLRLLAGLTRPTTGTIADRPEVVGFAPDRFPTAQPFTVTAYLRHMSRVRGGARWEPWAERLNMGHLLDTALSDLSKGSAHKVGLAQALMAEPGLLILDEPFAGLDADTRETLPAIATEVAARGGIVIASDHQGGLRALPAVRQWSVVDGHLKEGTSARPEEESTESHPQDGTAPQERMAGRHEGTDQPREGVVDRALDGVPGDPRDRHVVGRVRATVAVTLPVEELPGFLARMRDEGYQAREIEETG
ncbi:ABC transporter ATP-binding protein [Nonomuraea cypriaca]|nr:ATP-binding cassette domain-containing protein [Nonomuraea cypriaca]